MYYSVSVDHSSMAAYLTRSGCEKCCISSGMDGTDDVLWSGREEDGNFKS